MNFASSSPACAVQCDHHTDGPRRRGDEIVIMTSGRARARLVQFDSAPALRLTGRGQGARRVNAHFDALLSDDVLDAFEGESRGSCWIRTC